MWCLSLMVVVLAVTSVNIAIPSLQRGLDAGAIELLWIIGSFGTLVFAGTLLPTGALGDRFGRKDALVWASRGVRRRCAFAAVSTRTGQVIGARAVMGVAASFMMPATLPIITTVFPPADSRPSAATHRPTRQPRSPGH